MSLLVPRYDAGIVAASYLIASFAAYVALDLSQRVRSRDRASALAWRVGGSVAMGTGIWSMHFVGMLALSLPISLGYTALYTALSWVAGVAASGVALGIAARGRLNTARLLGGSIAMGAGICTMHYLGMAAIDLAPGIDWDPRWVLFSVAVAVAASAAALCIFFWLRQVNPRHALAWRIAAALVMGAAVCGMHYSGMAAAGFPEGAVCLSADRLGGAGLGGMVGVAAVLLMSATLFTSVLDARLQDRATRLAGSLKAANEELQSANAALHRQAVEDPLTGLPNRLLFEDRLGHAVRRIARGGRHGASARLAVLCVGLDGFKPVNDSLGHGAGDNVLRDWAARLRHLAREADTVARMGGDEFVLLMEDFGSAADAVAMARRVLDALALPFDVAGRELRLSASVGIVVHPDQGRPETLLANADAALQAAKRAGGAGWALFAEHMSADATDQLDLQSDLRQAVALGQLELHYQPKIDSRRGSVIGVEALLRWRHPQRGMVSPAQFIPVAERFGLINEMGNWVIDAVCRQLREWADQGLRMRAAFNLSVHQLRQDDLVERIGRALEANRLSPSQLLCEITESVAMEDVQATQETFGRLQRIGVYLAIDDFGTGYSSLSSLRQLPARQLKIDRSFIKDLDASADARAVVDAVIRLAHALGLRVVAEGVETAAQRDILRQLDCDELQGFLYARPMPPEALLAWAAEAAQEEAGAAFSPSLIDAVTTAR